MSPQNDTHRGPPSQGAVRFRWRLSENRFLESDRPVLLGILNATPDSFSDGGELNSTAAVVDRALKLIEDGADALDLGGESTRPGAQRVRAEEQIRRTAPAIEAIRAAGICVPVTIDTTLGSVARAALNAGADAVNDVSGATEDPEMLALVAERRCGVVLMHRLTTPDRDVYSNEYAKDPDYGGDVVRTVTDALANLLDAATRAGVEPDSVLVDPGLGFGKSVAQNARLLHDAGHIQETVGVPVLVGASRKSFLSSGGAVPPTERDPASVAAAAIALNGGVRFFRAHSVRPHRLALDSLDGLQKETLG